MSARKHCWHCGNALYANRGRIVRYPDGEVVVHASCLVETKEWLAESAGAGVTARPKGEP